jgi:hypothetical protein
VARIYDRTSEGRRGCGLEKGCPAEAYLDWVRLQLAAKRSGIASDTWVVHSDGSQSTVEAWPDATGCAFVTIGFWGDSAVT